MSGHADPDPPTPEQLQPFKDALGAEALHIPVERWQQIGTEAMPWGRLRITLILTRTFLHMEAVAVVERDGRQVACDPEWQVLLDELAALSEPDRAWQTARLGGREYVVYAHPHSA